MKPSMKFNYLGTGLLFLLLSACNEPTDEELRDDIVGKWEAVYCNFPYTSDPNNTYPFPGGKIVFRSNGSFVQQHHGVNVCRDSCGIDSISTSGSYTYCTCTWAIENGSIIIQADTSLHEGYFGHSIPILRLNNDCFVLDEFEFNGRWVDENACFERR